MDGEHICICTYVDHKIPYGGNKFYHTQTYAKYNFSNNIRLMHLQSPLIFDFFSRMQSFTKYLILSNAPFRVKHHIQLFY